MAFSYYIIKTTCKIKSQGSRKLKRLLDLPYTPPDSTITLNAKHRTSLLVVVVFRGTHFRGLESFFGEHLVIPAQNRIYFGKGDLKFLRDLATLPSSKRL